MGYELHITRGRFWAENEGHHISTEEWLSLIEADIELTLYNRNGPYFAVWSGSSQHEHSWLDWFEGNIHTKHPDRAMLGKMLQIADGLGATVQGDDGEIYKSVSDYPESLRMDQTEIRDGSRVPAYQRREVLWNFVIYGTVALIIIAANLLGFW
jgi:hypothetical protein